MALSFKNRHLNVQFHRKVVSNSKINVAVGKNREKMLNLRTFLIHFYALVVKAGIVKEEQRPCLILSSSFPHFSHS